METLAGSLYDFPKYYDLVFGSDWKAEFDFLRQCFQRFVSGRTRRVFEPACGTGRLLYRLAQAGYRVSGLDLNPRAADYCNARLRRCGFAGTASVGDMSRFALQHQVDAAFNLINSFRHLRSEAAARSHLECIARALRPGGIYVLGLHLTPTASAPTEEESWSARRGHLGVNTRLWTVRRDLSRREERCKMTCEVYTPSRQLCIEDEIIFRTYDLRQIRRLLRSVPQLEVLGVYDFAYDLDRPLLLDGAAEDTVLVLGRR
jgi:SAM-dependent methyltransferase